MKGCQYLGQLPFCDGGPRLYILTALNFYSWGESICSLYPLIKAQKWTMQSASKHEWVLFILRGTQALWKLAPEHGSKWNWHHGLNENWIPYIHLLQSEIFLFCHFEWFWNAFSFWAQSLQDWDMLCHFSLPSPAWLAMRAPIAVSSSLSTPIWGLATWNALNSVQQLLSFSVRTSVFLYCSL